MFLTKVIIYLFCYNKDKYFFSIHADTLMSIKYYKKNYLYYFDLSAF